MADNVRARTSGAVVVLTVMMAGATASCGTSSEQGAGDKRTVGETSTALPAPGEVIDLEVPLGEHQAYNAIAIAAGGVLVVGTADNVTPFQSEAPTVDHTLDSAYFDVATGTWTDLPHPPVDVGITSASGVMVGDEMFVLGRDCPPGPGVSSSGVSFHCGGGYAETTGPLVLLSWSFDDSTWSRHDVVGVSDSLVASRYPEIIGVAGSDIVINDAWGSRSVDRFDVANRAWKPPVEVPTRSAAVCVVDGELVALDSTADSAYDSADNTGPTPAAETPSDVTLWRFDGRIFVAAGSPFVGGIDASVCAGGSAYTFAQVVPGDTSSLDVERVDLTTSARSNVSRAAPIWSGVANGAPARIRDLLVISDGPVGSGPVWVVIDDRLAAFTSARFSPNPRFFTVGEFILIVDEEISTDPDAPTMLRLWNPPVTAAELPGFPGTTTSLVGAPG